MSINNSPLCMLCASRMVLKTVFKKQVYECPRCKRRIKVEDVAPEVENPETTSS